MTEVLATVERPAEGVGMIMLRRADRLNALSTELADALARAIHEVATDGGIRAIVVAGEGKAFCAGADISELDRLDGPQDFSRFVRRLTDAFDALASCPKPSVAAIHGFAFGGGLELAMACDLRVAERGARLGVPEIKLGVLPGAGGTARLPRLVPRAVAAQMLLTGEPLLAEEARPFGLVNEVAGEGQALSVAIGLATTLAASSPLALAAAKHLLAAGQSLSVSEAVELENTTVAGLFGSADRVEGVRAFLEKRLPRFGGR